MRRVKTDKKDAVKIAHYCLENFDILRKYESLDKIRQHLKLFSRQYNTCIKNVHAMENNLTSLLDNAYPGAAKFFASQKKANGRQKWVDFVHTFWHVDTVTSMSPHQFEEAYCNWCKQKSYRFTLSKAQEVYQKSQGQVTTLAKNKDTKLIIATAATQVIATSISLAQIKQHLVTLASQTPEYLQVLSLYGVGETTAAQLIAEIGDVRRFHSGRALVAYAGIDPLPIQSGTYNKKSTKTSKRGSPPLRKTLFQIVLTYLRHAPQDEQIYHFICRKKAEGKPYFVYMTAAANKFLRIYYARVNAFLDK